MVQAHLGLKLLTIGGHVPGHYVSYMSVLDPACVLFQRPRTLGTIGLPFTISDSLGQRGAPLSTGARFCLDLH
jgi:hypothetical protein